MASILFVCHGNICRSTMAQSVMAHLVSSQHLEGWLIDSAGTSDEEEGNSVHHGTRERLSRAGVPCIPHRARRITLRDAECFDHIIAMDAANVRNLKRALPQRLHSKITLLLDHTSLHRDISDPWYTGDFDQTYQDILKGCTALLQELT